MNVKTKVLLQGQKELGGRLWIRRTANVYHRRLRIEPIVIQEGEEAVKLIPDSALWIPPLYFLPNMDRL